MIKICMACYNEAALKPKTKENVKVLKAHPDFDFNMKGMSLLFKLRNMLVSGNDCIDKWQKLDKKYTHIATWDSDIWHKDPVGLIKRLVARDVDVVGAAYEQRLKKGELPHYCAVERIDYRDSYIGTERAGIVPVVWCGCGLMVVKREVYEGTEYPWYRHEYIENSTQKDQTPEDVGFCWNVARHGFKIYLDCDNKVHHHTERN